MKFSIRAAELSRMTPESRASAELEMARAVRSRPNGEIKDLDAIVRGFEQKYGFDSETMKRRLDGGSLRETTDICEWLLNLKLREHVLARARSG